MNNLHELCQQSLRCLWAAGFALILNLNIHILLGHKSELFWELMMISICKMSRASIQQHSSRFSIDYDQTPHRHQRNRTYKMLDRWWDWAPKHRAAHTRLSSSSRVIRSEQVKGRGLTTSRNQERRSCDDPEWSALSCLLTSCSSDNMFTVQTSDFEGAADQSHQSGGQGWGSSER